MPSSSDLFLFSTAYKIKESSLTFLRALSMTSFFINLQPSSMLSLLAITAISFIYSSLMCNLRSFWSSYLVLLISLWVSDLIIKSEFLDYKGITFNPKSILKCESKLFFKLVVKLILKGFLHVTKESDPAKF